MKLECINISSDDPKRLADFYSKLGINVFVKNENYDGFNFGNAENEAKICVWDKARWGTQKGDYITLVFNVEDLESTYNDLKSKGLDITPPIKTEWGGLKLMLNDPDGNEIMIL